MRGSRRAVVARSGAGCHYPMSGKTNASQENVFMKPRPETPKTVPQPSQSASPAPGPSPAGPLALDPSFQAGALDRLNPPSGQSRPARGLSLP